MKIPAGHAVAALCFEGFNDLSWVWALEVKASLRHIGVCVYCHFMATHYFECGMMIPQID